MTQAVAKSQATFAANKSSTVALESIRIDGGTQPRSRIDETMVSDYASAMRDGAEFPPIVLFFDGVDYWLADGFHRLHAARSNSQADIVAEIHTGTKRDAILYSVGANSAHGMRRTNDDKRRAVMTLLNDAEWTQWSNVEIANRCGVSDDLVRSCRPSLPLNGSESTRTFTNKHGTVSTMKTSNIGKRQTVVDSTGRTQTLREGHQPKSVRVQQIAELAAQGFRAIQIADRIGVDEKHVRAISNSHSIVLPDAALGKPHRIDSHRVIDQTVSTLESAAASLRTIPFKLDDISAADATDWHKSLSDSIRQFTSLRNKLKDHANVTN